MGIFSAMFGNGRKKISCPNCGGTGIYWNHAADEAGCASKSPCTMCGGKDHPKDWLSSFKNPGCGYVYQDENGDLFDKNGNKV